MKIYNKDRKKISFEDVIEWCKIYNVNLHTYPTEARIKIALTSLIHPDAESVRADLAKDLFKYFTLEAKQNDLFCIQDLPEWAGIEKDMYCIKLKWAIF